MGLFRPPIQEIIIDELIKYIYHKQTRQKPRLLFSRGGGLARSGGDEKLLKITDDFLKYVKKDVDSKTYKKIEDYFFRGPNNNL